MTTATFPASQRRVIAHARLADSRDRVYRAACALQAVADMTRLSREEANNAHAQSCRENLSGFFDLVGEYLMEAHDAADRALTDLEIPV